jgi:hypothetical protein
MIRVDVSLLWRSCARVFERYASKDSPLYAGELKRELYDLALVVDGGWRTK